MTCFRALALACLGLVSPALAGEPGPQPSAVRYQPLEPDAALFTQALATERSSAPAAPIRVTGITVPHHLLAADLIARGVLATAGNTYDRIVIVSPDHFSTSPAPMATTHRGFDTALGPVAVDGAAVDALLTSPDFVADSDLFVKEHGISAILPFLHAVHPATPIVPVTLGIGTTQPQWDRAVDLLKTIVTPRTLVVQSTDFSHYLSPAAARARDQETLNTIAADDPALIARLNQSNHLDSKAAQYIQARLQREVFASARVVVANRNSSAYAGRDGPSTSYVVSVFGPDPAALSRFAYPDQRVVVFGGDVFLGRWFTAPLMNQVTRDGIVAGLRRLTGGHALIVNLEGVLLTGTVSGAPAVSHVMDNRLAGPVLKALSITAAGLANNHSFDLGRDGLDQSMTWLRQDGIRPLEHGAVADFGSFRLLPLNLVGAKDVRGLPVWTGSLDGVCRLPAAPPLIVLVHWGQEYTSDAGGEEHAVAGSLARCGVGLIVGAHSHQAASRLELVGGGRTVMDYSLGNLLFDQQSPRGSSALLEVRFFAQGTFAARIVPAPNFYGLAVHME